MKDFFKKVEDNNFVEAFKIFDNYINSGINNINIFVEEFEKSSYDVKLKLTKVIKTFIELQKDNYRKGIYDDRNEHELKQCLEYSFKEKIDIFTLDDKMKAIYLKLNSGEIIPSYNYSKAIDDYKKSDNCFISELVMALNNNHRLLVAYTCIWFFKIIDLNLELFYEY